MNFGEGFSVTIILLVVATIVGAKLIADTARRL